MKAMSRSGLTIVGVLTSVLVAAGCAGTGEPAEPVKSSVDGKESTADVPASPPEPAPTTTQGIPPGLLLPDEGEDAEDADISAWKTDNTLDEKWLLDPCRPTEYPTDDDRTGFRTVSRTGPELFQARQLAVYPTEAVATEAFAGFTRVLTACRTGGDAKQGEAWQWNSEPIDAGDEGFVAASSISGELAAPFGHRVAATRVGTMVFLAYDEGEYGTATIDDGAREAQRVAEEFATAR